MTAPVDRLLPAEGGAPSGGRTPADDPWVARRDELALLLARTARGDRDAFGRLYELASPGLFAMLVRLLGRRSWAEEVLQECFVSVWQHAVRYDRDRSAPMTWMATIARNAALDLLRGRQATEAPLDEKAAADRPDEGPQPLEALQAGLEAQHVRRCMQALPGPQQQGLALAFFHGLSHAEVAQRLGQPLGTVKSWVRRGLLALKGCLESRDPALGARS